MKHLTLVCSLVASQISSAQEAAQLPDTQISGVYEVMLGVEEETYAIKYFTAFGFSVVDSSVFTEEEAQALYGVPSALKSIRMQNGDIDSHGLLRILVWDKPLGNGVGNVMAITFLATGRLVSIVH